MKTMQFPIWAVGWLSGGLTGKTTQFFEGDREENLVAVHLIYVISSVSRAGKLSSLYADFEGSQSRGCYRVWLSRWSTWKLIGLLAIIAAWKDLLGASALFWVTTDWVDGGVMVRLLEGNPVIITSTKWLSVKYWKMHRWSCKHTLTWLVEETDQNI